MENKVKLYNVTGDSFDEAMSFQPLNVVGDATRAYKAWKENSPNEADDVFAAEYIQKKKIQEGEGFFVTLVPAVPNTRSRCYEVTNAVTTGATKWESAYMLLDSAEHTILSVIRGSKNDAIKTAKELYTKGLKNPLEALRVKVAKNEGQAVAFTANYAPSKNTQQGSYMVFGLDK